MPSTATTTMLAASLDNRVPEIYEQTFDSHVLLDYMRENGRIKPKDPANNIEVNLAQGANSTFQVRDYKTEIPFAEQDPVQVAELPFRHINGSVVWYRWQEEVNESSKQKLFDFVDSLVDQAKDTLADLWGLQLWQAGAGENLHGIGAIIDAGTGTGAYMGITRTAAGNSWFRAKTGAQFTVTRTIGGAVQTLTYGPYNTNGLLQIMGGTDGGIQRLINDCSANGGTDQPDFGITSMAGYQRIEQLIEPSRIRQNEAFVKLGWPENIQYGNMGIVWDVNTPSTSGGVTQDFFALNTKYLWLCPSTRNAKQYYVSSVLDREPDGLRAFVKIFNWDGNLVCPKPARCGALTNKTVA